MESRTSAFGGNDYPHFDAGDAPISEQDVLCVGRGYHAREIDSPGGPVLDQELNREIFEEQIEIIM